VAAVALTAFALRLLGTRERRSERQALEPSWGGRIERQRNVALYRELFPALPAAVPCDTLDDQTWLDLEMDRVFAHVDRTLSTPGRLALYGFLRQPALSGEVLAARDRIMEAISREEPLRRAFRKAFARVGRATRSEASLPDLLWSEGSLDERSDPWLGIFGMAGAASLVAAVVLGGGFIVAAVVVFGVNAHWNVRTRVRHQETCLALAELGALFRCARELSRITHPALADRADRLKRALEATKDVARSVAFVSAGRVQDLLYEYVSVLLLLEARAIRRAERQCRLHADDLRAIYAVVGEVDALQAAASFRQGLATWSKPVWSSTGERVRLEIVGAVHPLLAGARPNDIRLDGRGCVVTGPNMSGKSTLLRTLGVNAVLAQTLLTCTAARYEGSFLLVRSSMCVADNLAAGKSLYLAEVERMLVLIRAAERGDPVLCLVDELLAGTNSSDRSAASAAILGYLASHRSLVVASTHDADLAESLSASLDPLHFESGSAADSHQVRPGVTRERNAVAILRTLGFPPQVLEALEAP
jgi:MutS domain V